MWCVCMECCICILCEYVKCVCVCVFRVQFVECVGVWGWYGIRDMGIYVLCGAVRMVGIICMCLCVM